MDGKVGVITGAGRGIGRATALLMAKEGATGIVVNDYGVALDGTTPSSEPANEVVKAIESMGGSAVASAQSVATAEGAEEIIKTCVDKYGRIDFLVTAAGFLRDRILWNMPEEDFDAVTNVHFKGTFLCGRAAAQAMRQQRSGAIVTFTSVAHQGNPGQSNYSGAKGAIASMSYTWAMELGRYGVRVNILAPGAQTRMIASIPGRETIVDPTPEQSVMSPDNVAPAIVYLTSDLSRHVTGQVVGISGENLEIWYHPRPKVVAKKAGGWDIQSIGSQITDWRPEFEALGFYGLPYQTVDEMEAAAQKK
jgi:NAD(P)-dependent dehydrogenase (short-subunit alcohol dehydrogenase family)